MPPSAFAEQVLDLVATIPPGRVLCYGDVADLLGTRAPRAVGSALARFGGGCPWWRVVRADGRPAPGHEQEAAARLRAEGVPLLVNPLRVDLARARWDRLSAGTGPRPTPAR